MAEVFGKEHKHVLDKIKNLECSDTFTGSNFRLSHYHDSTGRKLPMYEMTQDGWESIGYGHALIHFKKIGSASDFRSSSGLSDNAHSFNPAQNWGHAINGSSTHPSWHVERVRFMAISQS